MLLSLLINFPLSITAMAYPESGKKILKEITDSKVKDVYLGYTRSAALTDNGDLYCWGFNEYGQVGNGTKEIQSKPVKILENVVSVALEDDYSAAVTSNGDLYCWGANYYGQIGDGTKEDRTRPVKVLEDVASVALENSYSAAVTNTGDLYLWGWNIYGNIGNGTEEDKSRPVKVMENVKSVALGYFQSAAVTHNGDLYCWGKNDYGQIGDGTEKNRNRPVKVLENVASMDLSYNRTAAITVHGDLYCWGENSYGSLGDGTEEHRNRPVKILEEVRSVVLGSDYSAAVTINGDLYCWGEDSWDRLGNGTEGNQNRPMKILERVQSVALGSGHGAAVTSNGDLYCWGWNESGQVGNGTVENQNRPVKIMENVESVVLEGKHSAAVTRTEDLYLWGWNEFGQIGNGTKENQSRPIKIDLVHSGGDPSFPTDGEINVIDNSKITVNAVDYDKLTEGEIEGAVVSAEGIGEAVTDAYGTASMENTLDQPSAMKRISVTKEGYRDYIFYTTIVSPENVSLFETNRLHTYLKKKKAGDDTNPYVSSIVYYQNEIAKLCGGQHFVKTDNVTFRACGVWNDKEPGHYCMYQEGGKSFESEDGIFRLNIGESFLGNGKIYVKLVAADGTESEPERVYITVPTGNASQDDDDSIQILSESGESGWQTDVPFLNNDKLSFDLGKIKTTVKRDGSKIRIMLGAEGSQGVFTDEEWENWKKFCESQPTDLSLSQWRNVLASDNLNTSWTAGAKLKATGYGWLENDLSGDAATPLTGGIQVIIDMSTSFKQQYAVGVIPVYLEESLGVNGKLDAGVTFDTQNRKFGGSTKLTVTPSLSVGGGVGVLYVATVGAEGKASMPITIDFPKGLTQADLIGALSIKASVLGFSYSKELASATYPLYPTRESKAVQNEKALGQSLYDMDSYVLPQKLETASVWHGEDAGDQRISKSTASNLKETLLETGTSELTEPQLVQEGNTTLAVFLTEDPLRDTIHRTKLVYTVYDESRGEWSSPVAVEEDGTGDFYPYLTASNGTIGVAWLNYDSGITNASSMQEALQNSQIRYAVWDEGSNGFVKSSISLSSDEAVTYNSACPCMDSNGDVTLVGLKNKGGDIFGTTGENLLFMTGTCEGEAVRQEFVLTQGTPVSYDADIWGNIVTAAVCMDTDRDLSTLEDREIYRFSSDGTVEKLTENESYDAAPQYARYQGGKALFWYTEQGYEILEESGKQSAVLEENANISESFTVVNGANQNTALVWSSVDDTDVYQLTACILDEASGKWSSPVAVSDSEENIFRPSGYFNSDGDMEFLYRKGDTASAGSLYALQAAQAPDLQILDAYMEDGAEIPGQSAKVFVGVRNLGTEKVDSYRIAVGGQITEGSVEILPGESALLEAEYAVPEAVESRKIPVEVTTEGDRDASNNGFQMTAGFADVSVATMEDVWESGKVVHVTVTNHEAVSSKATLEVRKNTKDGEVIAAKDLGTLGQGDILTMDFAYPKDSSGYETDADALYYVVTSSAAERYESNNYGYSVFREEGAENPDQNPETPDTGEEPDTKPSTPSEDAPTGSAGDSGQKPASPAPGGSGTSEQSAVKVGQTVTIKKLRYKVTKVNKNGGGQVTLVGTTRKKSDKKFRTLKIGSAVKIRGKAFQITAIGKGAFSGYRGLKSVSIGKNVKTIGDKSFYRCIVLAKVTIPPKTSKIGKQAFYGCKKLKNAVIKTKSLTTKKVGKKAFGAIHPRTMIKVPKSKVKAYKKLLEKKGVGSKAKIKKL